LFDQQIVQQMRDVVVVELFAIVGMKTADHEQELLQHRFQYGHQPEF
jgi:hypothetical protein